MARGLCCHINFKLTIEHAPPATGDKILTCRKWFTGRQNVSAQVSPLAFWRSVRLLYVAVHSCILLGGHWDNIGFSDVFVGYPVWIVSTLFRLFTSYHKIEDLFPLLGSISTATVVPTLPETFLRGHRLSGYANIFWSVATVEVPLALEIPLYE